MNAFRGATGTGHARLATVCALSACLGASCATTEAASAVRSAMRMADGNQWTTENLNVESEGSYCFGDAAPNCDRYGRLYTWDAAVRVCRTLGSSWRLPTESEWRTLAERHGGLFGGTGGGNASLVAGGGAGFDAMRGGNRTAAGLYERLEAHGFYWTASETRPSQAWFYNFGRASDRPNRHEDGEKQMAVSVRCIST